MTRNKLKQFAENADIWPVAVFIDLALSGAKEYLQDVNAKENFSVEANIAINTKRQACRDIINALTLTEDEESRIRKGEKEI